MRVLPNRECILPGYLYAYLSSKFGIPQIVSGTYGSIIQSIESHHIANLPVPRLGNEIEQKVHELVQEAAEKRTEAINLLNRAERLIIEELGSSLPTFSNDKRRLGHKIQSHELIKTRRFEGYFHNPNARDVDLWVQTHANGFWNLSEVATVYDVPPFKHIYVEGTHGVPFFTSGELFKLDRRADKYLSRKQTKDLHKYILKRGWVLLARSGQLGGIIGRPQFADSALDGAATSDHVIRIVPKLNLVTPGYLYAYLAASSLGYPLLTRTMTGASVPALWPVYLNQIKVVQASKAFMKSIDEIVQEAFEMRIEATLLEERARETLENVIEEAA